MRGTTHIAFALTIALLIDRFLPPISFFSLSSPLPFLFYPVIVVAALIPDIDLAGSLLGKHAKAVGFIAGHRTVFHSLWMAALASVLAYLVRPWLAIPVALGILSHLLLDALTHAGISWLYPFGKTKGFVKSGGIVDWMLFFAFFVIAAGFLLAKSSIA